MTDAVKLHPHIYATGHEPVIDHDRCDRCNTLLRKAFNQMADMDLGPKDASTLVNQIRRLAIGMEEA